MLEHGNQLQINVNMIKIEDNSASLHGDRRGDRLLSRGYSETDVVKIVGGNFMRVFREVVASAG
jgi:microsomal dipeptidase-like Zn-dependent dipeptidase